MITKEICEEKLKSWLEAEEAVSTGQSYSINTGGSTRTVTRANLKEISDRISYWERKLNKFNGKKKVKYINPDW